MKKRLICCGVLCLVLVLFCGVVMADDAPVITVDDAYKSSVTVTYTPKGEDAAFKVEKSGLDSGTNQLYLVLIMTGSSTTGAITPPTTENVYYLDVQPSSGTTVSFDAYPRQMDEGTYVVYLSDYSSGNNGALKGAALIEVKNSAGDQKLGDINDDEMIDPSDALLAMRIFAGLKNGNADWTAAELKAANVNGDDYVDPTDALLMMQHFAGLVDDNFVKK